jgi:hypothetical protein
LWCCSLETAYNSSREKTKEVPEILLEEWIQTAWKGISMSQLSSDSRSAIITQYGREDDILCSDGQLIEVMKKKWWCW